MLCQVGREEFFEAQKPVRAVFRSLLGFFVNKFSAVFRHGAAQFVFNGVHGSKKPVFIAFFIADERDGHVGSRFVKRAHDRKFRSVQNLEKIYQNGRSAKKPAFGDQFGKKAQIVRGVGLFRTENRIVSAVNERNVAHGVRCVGRQQRVGGHGVFLEHLYAVAERLVKINIGIARVIFQLRRNGIERGGDERRAASLSDRTEGLSAFGKRESGKPFERNDANLMKSGFAESG